MKALALTIATIALISSTPDAHAENAVSFERSYVTHEWRQISVLTSQPKPPGNAILPLNTNELTEKWATIENAPGVEIISKPNLMEYPRYGGKGEIRALVSKFYGADGYILEVNQILPE